MIRFLWWILSLCWHYDEIVETRVFPSPYDQQKAFIAEVGDGNIATEFLPWFFASGVVTIVRCKHCGRVKHICTSVRP